MPTEAHPLAPWVAPVTASCGRGRADAHTAYSCQFPCWDPSRACFLHEGVGSGADLQSRASTGRRARSPGWRRRARAASLQPAQTPPATSLPCSLLCPESGSPENGVGGPLPQVPAAERKGQAGLRRKAGVRACLAGSASHPRARAGPPEGLCLQPAGSPGPTKPSLQ